MKRLLALALLLPAPAMAQQPSPAQVGITTATPNAFQVIDSSHTWATIGTIDPVTHLFTAANSTLPPLVNSFNTRTGAVTLNSGDVTGALGFTPYNNTNPANYVNAAGAAAAAPVQSVNTRTGAVVINSGDVTTALGFTPIPASGAPVQSVATRTGAVTLTHSDITDWNATLLPYALLNSPAFTGTPSLPTGTTGVTQTVGDSSTKLATTAFVGAAGAAGTGAVKNGVTPTDIANTNLIMSDGTHIVQAANAFLFGTLTTGSIYYSSWITGGVQITGQYLGDGSWDIQPANPPWLVSELSYGGATQPVSFRVYNNHTDASNGEWATIDWLTTSNTLLMGTQNNGTGAARNLELVVGGVNKLDWGVTVAGAWSSIGNFGSTGAMVSRGTAPTITGAGGTCATTTKVGGAWAGTVVLSAVCATTNTIAWTGMPTVPNGYVCDAEDRTTRTAGPFIESASTTTGFTLTVGATSSVAADVLQWKCMGY